MQAPDKTPARQELHLGEQELAAACRLRLEDVRELVEYGALAPLQAGEGAEPVFSVDLVPQLREVARLCHVFDLDLFSAGLMLKYLQRIAELEHQVRLLQAHVPHSPHAPREGPANWHEPHG